MIKNEYQKILNLDKIFDGELCPDEKKGYFVCGNPKRCKSILIFEKGVMIETFNQKFPSHNFYLVSGLGSPSKELLKHLYQYKKKRMFYFGDFDPTSFWIYFEYKYGKNFYNKRLNVSYAGVTLEDTKKIEKYSIKLTDYENQILSFLRNLKHKDLKKEINELLISQRKFEIDAFVQNLEEYFKNKKIW